MGILLYILALLGVFCIAILLCVYLILSVYSTLMGSPFVPTRQKQLHDIFSSIPLKKGLKFIELGSGDGRVCEFVYRNYGLTALGVEINPLLIAFARLRAKIKYISHIKFVRQSFFDVDLLAYDIIYFFLLPATIKKLAPKFIKECKPGTIIVSHGFAIHPLQKNLYKKIDATPFNTFIYKIE